MENLSRSVTAKFIKQIQRRRKKDPCFHRGRHAQAAVNPAELRTRPAALSSLLNVLSNRPRVLPEPAAKRVVMGRPARLFGGRKSERNRATGGSSWRLLPRGWAIGTT
ncbi:MAG: hypothetical protein JWP03_1389 [Phycisphaerales bacterium]|nr:hypothetical protein [Phycisphaerales bacterium]